MRGRSTKRRERHDLRPTTAKVRDALFNRLGPQVEAATVLDLFAGTGNLGLEALRRGAQRAVFVERDARRARVIQDLLRQEGFDNRAEVRVEDAVAAAQALGRGRRMFDYILIDPPYGQGWLTRALEAVAHAGILSPDGVIAAEGHWRDRPDLPAGLVLAREARYGETVLWFIRGEPRP